MALFVDFVGLNTLIQEPIDTSTNTVGNATDSRPASESYEDGEVRNTSIKTISAGDYLAALNAHRNGPYGHAIFTQVRAGQNPIIRRQRLDNTFSHYEYPGETLVHTSGRNIVHRSFLFYKRMPKAGEEFIIKFDSANSKFVRFIDNSAGSDSAFGGTVPQVLLIDIKDSTTNTIEGIATKIKTAIDTEINNQSLPLRQVRQIKNRNGFIHVIAANAPGAGIAESRVDTSGAASVDGGNILGETKNIRNVVPQRRGPVEHFCEVPVVSKHRPLKLVGAVKGIDENNDLDVMEEVEIFSTLGNETQYFSNTKINKFFDLEEDISDGYENFIDLYLEGGLDGDESPIDEFQMVRYKQVVYPKELYTYKNHTRNRINFVSRYWRDSREDRTKLDVSNGFGFQIFSQSAWVLDSEEDFKNLTFGLSPGQFTIQHPSRFITGSDGVGSGSTMSFTYPASNTNHLQRRAYIFVDPRDTRLTPSTTGHAGLPYSTSDSYYPIAPTGIHPYLSVGGLFGPKLFGYSANDTTNSRVNQMIFATNYFDVSTRRLEALFNTNLSTPMESANPSTLAGLFESDGYQVVSTLQERAEGLFRKSNSESRAPSSILKQTDGEHWRRHTTSSCISIWAAPAETHLNTFGRDLNNRLTGTLYAETVQVDGETFNQVSSKRSKIIHFNKDPNGEVVFKLGVCFTSSADGSKINIGADEEGAVVYKYRDFYSTENPIYNAARNHNYNSPKTNDAYYIAIQSTNHILAQIDLSGSEVGTPFSDARFQTHKTGYNGASTRNTVLPTRLFINGREVPHPSVASDPYKFLTGSGVARQQYLKDNNSSVRLGNPALRDNKYLYNSSFSSIGPFGSTGFSFSYWIKFDDVNSISDENNLIFQLQNHHHGGHAPDLAPIIDHSFHRGRLYVGFTGFDGTSVFKKRYKATLAASLQADTWYNITFTTLTSSTANMDASFQVFEKGESSAKTLSSAFVSDATYGGNLTELEFQALSSSVNLYVAPAGGNFKLTDRSTFADSDLINFNIDSLAFWNGGLTNHQMLSLVSGSVSPGGQAGDKPSPNINKSYYPATDSGMAVTATATTPVFRSARRIHELNTVREARGEFTVGRSTDRNDRYFPFGANFHSGEFQTNVCDAGTNGAFDVAFWFKPSHQNFRNRSISVGDFSNGGLTYDSITTKRSEAKKGLFVSFWFKQHAVPLGMGAYMQRASNAPIGPKLRIIAQSDSWTIGIYYTSTTRGQLVFSYRNEDGEDVSFMENYYLPATDDWIHLSVHWNGRVGQQGRCEFGRNGAMSVGGQRFITGDVLGTGYQTLIGRQKTSAPYPVTNNVEDQISTVRLLGGFSGEDYKSQAAKIAQLCVIQGAPSPDIFTPVRQALYNNHDYIDAINGTYSGDTITTLLSEATKNEGFSYAMTPNQLGVSMEAGNWFNSLDAIPPVGSVTMGRNGREEVWKWDNTSTNYGHWSFQYRTEALNNNRSPFMLDSNDGVLTGFTLGFYFKAITQPATSWATPYVSTVIMQAIGKNSDGNDQTMAQMTIYNSGVQLLLRYAESSLASFSTKVVGVNFVGQTTQHGVVNPKDILLTGRPVSVVITTDLKTNSSGVPFNARLYLQDDNGTTYEFISTSTNPGDGSLDAGNFGTSASAMIHTLKLGVIGKAGMDWAISDVRFFNQYMGGVTTTQTGPQALIDHLHGVINSNQFTDSSPDMLWEVSNNSDYQNIDIMVGNTSGGTVTALGRTLRPPTFDVMLSPANDPDPTTIKNRADYAPVIVDYFHLGSEAEFANKKLDDPLTGITLTNSGSATNILQIEDPARLDSGPKNWRIDAYGTGGDVNEDGVQNTRITQGSEGELANLFYVGDQWDNNLPRGGYAGIEILLSSSGGGYALQTAFGGTTTDYIYNSADNIIRPNEWYHLYASFSQVGSSGNSDAPSVVYYLNGKRLSLTKKQGSGTFAPMDGIWINSTTVDPGYRPALGGAGATGTRSFAGFYQDIAFWNNNDVANRKHICFDTYKGIRAGSSYIDTNDSNLLIALKTGFQEGETPVKIQRIAGSVPSLDGDGFNGLSSNDRAFISSPPTDFHIDSENVVFSKALKMVLGRTDDLYSPFDGTGTGNEHLGLCTWGTDAFKLQDLEEDHNILSFWIDPTIDPPTHTALADQVVICSMGAKGAWHEDRPFYRLVFKKDQLRLYRMAGDQEYVADGTIDNTGAASIHQWSFNTDSSTSGWRHVVVSMPKEWSNTPQAWIDGVAMTTTATTYSNNSAGNYAGESSTAWNSATKAYGSTAIGYFGINGHGGRYIGADYAGSFAVMDLALWGSTTAATTDGLVAEVYNGGDRLSVEEINNSSYFDKLRSWWRLSPDGTTLPDAAGQLLTSNSYEFDYFTPIRDTQGTGNGVYRPVLAAARGNGPLDAFTKNRSSFTYGPKSKSFDKNNHTTVISFVMSPGELGSTRSDLFVFSSDYQDNGTTSFVDSSNVPRDNKRKVATLQVRRSGDNMVFDWETIRISELRRDSAHTPDLERTTIGSFYDPAKTIAHYVVIIKANEIQINRFGMNATQFKTLAEDTDYDFLGSWEGPDLRDTPSIKNGWNVIQIGSEDNVLPSGMLLDEVAVLRYKKSELEFNTANKNALVTELYNGGKSYNYFQKKNNLYAWWRMGENAVTNTPFTDGDILQAGNRIADEQDNARHLTVLFSNRAKAFALTFSQSDLKNFYQFTNTNTNNPNIPAGVNTTGENITQFVDSIGTNHLEAVAPGDWNYDFSYDSFEIVPVGWLAGNSQPVAFGFGGDPDPNGPFAGNPLFPLIDNNGQGRKLGGAAIFSGQITDNDQTYGVTRLLITAAPEVGDVLTCITNPSRVPGGTGTSNIYHMKFVTAGGSSDASFTQDPLSHGVDDYYARISPSAMDDTSAVLAEIKTILENGTNGPLSSGYGVTLSDADSNGINDTMEIRSTNLGGNGEYDILFRSKSSRFFSAVTLTGYDNLAKALITKPSFGYINPRHTHMARLKNENTFAAPYFKGLKTPKAIDPVEYPSDETIKPFWHATQMYDQGTTKGNFVDNMGVGRTAQVAISGGLNVGYDGANIHQADAAGAGEITILDSGSTMSVLLKNTPALDLNFVEISASSYTFATSSLSPHYGSLSGFISPKSPQSLIGGSTGARARFGPGILQNNYNQFTQQITTGESQEIDPQLSASACYFRRHTLTASTSFVSPNSGFLQKLSASHGSGSIKTHLLGNMSASHLYLGSAKWEAGDFAGSFNEEGVFIKKKKAPFYDTYSDFISDARPLMKDYGIVPEFKISDHVSRYLIQGPTEQKQAFLNLTGALESADTSNKKDFYKIYSTTDFLKHFDIVQEDHSDFTDPFSVKLKCSVVKKFLPYEGFYPAQRSVQVAQQFFDSYGANINISGNYDLEGSNSFGIQYLLNPLFSPGILYNTIKSGVAVDYPLITDTGSIKKIVGAQDGGAMIRQQFDTRVPFEALIEPEKHLANVSLASNEPDPNGDTGINIEWGGQGNELYNLMISNFLAETSEFFLRNKTFTTIASLPQGDANFGNARAGEIYSMRLKMFRTTEGTKFVPKNHSGKSFGLPQDTGSMSSAFTMYSRPSAFGPPQYLSQSTAAKEFTALTWADYKFDGTSGSMFITDDQSPTFDLKGLPFQHDFSYVTGSLYGDATLETGPGDRVGGHLGYNFGFTPPYYHGEAWADITFIPKESKKFSLQEIINQSSVEFYRYFQSSSAGSNPTLTGITDDTVVINDQAMQLASSVNIFSQGVLEQDITVEGDSTGIGSTTNVQVDTDISNKYRWVIQTKFETPMLNFQHYTYGKHTITGSSRPGFLAKGSGNKYVAPNANSGRDNLPSYTDNQYGIELPGVGPMQTPIGMWHQYGHIPQNPKEGVFLQVDDMPKSWILNAMHVPEKQAVRHRSLAKLCGFSTDPIRMGELDGIKEISEAVVAIPFYESQGSRRFFDMHKRQIRFAQNPTMKNLVGETVIDMVEKMKKYVIPPQFDFVENPEIQPFSMYIFEFTHNLTKQDLSDIWQNLPPEIHETVEVDEASISHPLLAYELLGKGGTYRKSKQFEVELNRNERSTFIEPKIQWLVFKVKKRAKSNYFEKIFARNESQQLLSRRLKLGVSADALGRKNRIGFNWPYDFFSLIEGVKLTAEVDFYELDDIKSAEAERPVKKVRFKRSDQDKEQSKSVANKSLKAISGLASPEELLKNKSSKPVSELSRRMGKIIRDRRQNRGKKDNTKPRGGFGKDLQSKKPREK